MSHNKLNTACSSVIISIYKDIVALDLILSSLATQTYKNFEIIVSEDGESNEVRDYMESHKHRFPGIQHLTQPDVGFRKNRALNRAIVASNCEHLIFIDGDCIPHKNFIEAHRKYAQKDTISAGRRVELGENISNKLREHSIILGKFDTNFKYFLSLFENLRDNTKNYEYGFYLRIFSFLLKDRPIKILGCNFSCFKNDLLEINGFNEDFTSPGLGEDSDIEWRLKKNGVNIKNVKLTAIQYHLYHPRRYNVSNENKKILEKTRQQNLYVCKNGIRKNSNT